MFLQVGNWASTAAVTVVHMAKLLACWILVCFAAGLWHTCLANLLRTVLWRCAGPKHLFADSIVGEFTIMNEPLRRLHFLINHTCWNAISTQNMNHDTMGCYCIISRNYSDLDILARTFWVSQCLSSSIHLESKFHLSIILQSTHFLSVWSWLDMNNVEQNL